MSVSGVPGLVRAELMEHPAPREVPRLLPVVGDEGVDHQGQVGRGGIAPGLPRSFVHQRDGVLHMAGIVGVGDVPVADPARATHGGVDVAAQQDRRTTGLGGRRRHAHPVAGEHLALVGEALARPRAPQDRDRVDQARDPFLDRNAEHPELLLAPADAQAEREPSVGELIDHGRILGEPDRIVERGEDHARAQADAARGVGERPQHHHERRQVAVARNRGAR